MKLLLILFGIGLVFGGETTTPPLPTTPPPPSSSVKDGSTSSSPSTVANTTTIASTEHTSEQVTTVNPATNVPPTDTDTSSGASDKNGTTVPVTTIPVTTTPAITTVAPSTTKMTDGTSSPAPLPPSSPSSPTSTPQPSSSQPTTNPSPSTLAPSTVPSKIPVTTNVTTTVAGSTSPVTNNPSSMPSTNPSTAPPVGSTTPNSTSSSSTEPTSSPSTTTLPTTTSMVPVTSPDHLTPVFLINEFTYTGLFAGGKEIPVFVEVLKKSGPSDTNVTVIVFTGQNLTQCQEVLQVTGPWSTDLQVQNATLTTSDAVHGVLVGLYVNAPWSDCTDYDHSNNATAMHDVMMVSNGKDRVNPPANIVNIFDVLIADSSFFKGAKVSVTRCDNSTMNPGSFVIANETRNGTNDCKILSSKFKDTVKMTLNSTNCEVLKTEQTAKKLKEYIAKYVGREITSGFSPVSIVKTRLDCAYSTFTWTVYARSKDQLVRIKNQFKTMIDLHRVDGKCFDPEGQFCPVKTCTDCKHLPNKDKSNIQVTVGVVIACVVIFLIVVAIVIIVIRRKRRGILQFRMTRLDEDDDDLMMNAGTDDFIGNQGASFTNSTYDRFT